tara:strand:+ start:995 stop:2314 length:1320 start_codon:yes stop_codon:yes gene_type:complete
MIDHAPRKRVKQEKPSLFSVLPWFRIVLGALMLFAGYSLGRGALSWAHETVQNWEGPKLSEEAKAFLMLEGHAADTIPDESPVPEKNEPAIQPLVKKSEFSKSMAGQDPRLVQKMRWLLDDYEVPEGAVVVLHANTGDVLAAVGRRNGRSDVGAALEAKWPAASVFKMVTASALLEEGLGQGEKVCFNGGLRKVTKKQLDQRKGARCSNILTAFAKSQNIPFARWTDQKLNPNLLQEEALLWGFGDANRFALPNGSYGTPTIPKERLSFAQTGAGFGDVPLSPIHGAMMAAAVANGGSVPMPKLNATQEPVYLPVLSEKGAATLQKAMVQTVSKGSARRAFRERRRPAMGRLGAGGKTGSLFVESRAGMDLTWFVGFAPAKNPKVAVAAYIINGPKWRIRAPYVAREAMRAALLNTSPYRPTQDPLLVKKKTKTRSAAR